MTAEARSVGVLNTGLIRPGDAGSWKNILGWVMVALAVFDTFQLHRLEQSTHRPVERAADTVS